MDYGKNLNAAKSEQTQKDSMLEQKYTFSM